MSSTTEVDRMARTTRLLWWVGAVVTAATVLSAPATAAATVGGSTFTAVARGTTASELGPEQADAAQSRGGLDRRDAVAAAAILAGVVLMGFRGYVAVGAVIAGAAAMIAAGARFVTGEPKHRAWKDWPGPVAAPDAKQDEEHRPIGNPEPELQ
jgi:hypothetical protein